MRLLTVKAPSGQARAIAGLAFAAGAAQVSVRQETELTSLTLEKPVDVVEVQGATPIIKKMVESLMEAPFYNPKTFAFSTRHPESLFASGHPSEETHPITRPTTDVYQELWQFAKITVSLVARVFFAAVLMAFGMLKDMLPLMLAGLLFLPYHHHMLGLALSGVLREWSFFWQALSALLASTALILLAGVCVAVFTDPPIGYEQFGTPLAGVVLSLVIGAASAFAAIDDAGRTELIGLAATAHISVYPAWLGMKLVFGINDPQMAIEHAYSFGMNLIALIVAAAIVFSIMRMRGAGLRKYVRLSIAK